MAREAAPEEPEDDVPAWVMTFSDVITLLMTFFILLLTFASNTPETFDRLQVTLFGGGGAKGIAGDSDGMDQDAVLMRERARSGRLSKDGSAMAPIYSDPAFETISKGIAGLDKDENDHSIFNEYRLVLDRDAFSEDKSSLSTVVVQQLKMLGSQLRRLPILDARLVASDPSDSERLFTIANYLIKTENIDISRLGIAVSRDHVTQGAVLILLRKQGKNRGEA